MRILLMLLAAMMLASCGIYKCGDNANYISKYPYDPTNVINVPGALVEGIVCPENLPK